MATESTGGGTTRDLIRDGLCGRGHSINGESDVIVDAVGIQRCVRCLAEMKVESVAARGALEREHARRYGRRR